MSACSACGVSLPAEARFSPSCGVLGRAPLNRRELALLCKSHGLRLN